MAVKEFKDWILGNEEEEETLDSGFSQNTSIFENTSKLNINDGVDYEEFSNKSSQMIVFEPRSYAESQGIADHLKSGRGCIINLHRVSKDQAKRIIDFLSGVVYAIEGEVQKIGTNVFLCTPSNFGVYGEISDAEE